MRRKSGSIIAEFTERRFANAHALGHDQSVLNPSFDPTGLSVGFSDQIPSSIALRMPSKQRQLQIHTYQCLRGLIPAFFRRRFRTLEQATTHLSRELIGLVGLQPDGESCAATSPINQSSLGFDAVIEQDRDGSLFLKLSCQPELLHLRGLNEVRPSVYKAVMSALTKLPVLSDFLCSPNDLFYWFLNDFCQGEETDKACYKEMIDCYGEEEGKEIWDGMRLKPSDVARIFEPYRFKTKLTKTRATKEFTPIERELVKWSNRGLDLASQFTKEQSTFHDQGMRDFESMEGRWCRAGIYVDTGTSEETLREFIDEAENLTMECDYGYAGFTVEITPQDLDLVRALINHLEASLRHLETLIKLFHGKPIEECAHAEHSN